jgi:hypothetical protein
MVAVVDFVNLVVVKLPQSSFCCFPEFGALPAAVALSFKA